eukprot:scaffold576_cov260-Pinguiococcus_pyrenoidosus.AAC.95
MSRGASPLCGHCKSGRIPEASTFGRETLGRLPRRGPAFAETLLQSIQEPMLPRKRAASRRRSSRQAMRRADVIKNSATERIGDALPLKVLWCVRV